MIISVGSKLALLDQAAQAAPASRKVKAARQEGLQVLMLLLQSLQDDGDQLNVAITQPLVLNLLTGAASVSAADTPGLLCLHLCLLQLAIGGVHLLQQLSPAESSKSCSCTSVTSFPSALPEL